MQLVSVEKTVLLTEKLLDGVLTNEEMDFVLPYSVVLNTYLMYEVVSDNLAMGLAKHQEADATFEQRRELLSIFNTIISKNIRNIEYIEPQETLEQLKSQIRTISAFDQSLNPMQHEKIAAAFLKDNRDIVRPEDLEYGLYASLMANMRSCKALTDVLREFQAVDIIQDGLARRYEGVNRLLQGGPIPIETLVQLGSDTMLVIPTVGYYVALMGEILRPTLAYSTILSNGDLVLALKDASLLVRLLNDIGTGVLTQSSNERQEMINIMHEKSDQAENFELLLYNMTETSGLALTRLKKDLKYGEFNVGLHAALLAENTADAINIFEEQLDYLTTLYDQTQQSLDQVAKRLSIQWGGTALAEIIVRFVRFHEITYSMASDDSSGEYAI